MSEHGMERELEDLLVRLVPGLAEQWKGATPDEVEQLERIAGRPLPPFYRWFLGRMGRSMGALTYPSLDFSAATLLTCYAEKVVSPDPRFLLVAYESDEVMPLHFFYDFSAPARDDALVTARDAQGGELYDKFESLRELLAWGALYRFRIRKLPQQCEGSLKGDDPDLLSRLDLVMDDLGFTQPMTTGPLCRLYEGPNAVMICNGVPRFGGGHIRSFTLGGSNAARLRRVLGPIALESSWELKVHEWSPALP